MSQKTDPLTFVVGLESRQADNLAAVRFGVRNACVTLWRAVSPQGVWTDNLCVIGAAMRP
jgi:hypothetical protein